MWRQACRLWRNMRISMQIEPCRLICILSACCRHADGEGGAWGWGERLQNRGNPMPPSLPGSLRMISGREGGHADGMQIGGSFSAMCMAGAVAVFGCACGLAICHLPPATCHLPPATCHLPPATCHLPPATCHLPPATCHLPHGHAATRPPPARCHSIPGARVHADGEGGDDKSGRLPLSSPLIREAGREANREGAASVLAAPDMRQDAAPCAYLLRRCTENG